MGATRWRGSTPNWPGNRLPLEGEEEGESVTTRRARAAAQARWAREKGGLLMARWRPQRSAKFEDMPRRLVDAHDDKTKRERRAWLERHGLALVDLQAWRRSRGPPRRCGRRHGGGSDELSRLDAEREREEWRW